MIINKVIPINCNKDYKNSNSSSKKNIFLPDTTVTVKGDTHLFF